MITYWTCGYCGHEFEQPDGQTVTHSHRWVAPVASTEPNDVKLALDEENAL